MEMTPLVHELLRRIADKGTNPKRLALDVGLNENAVRDIVVGKSKNPGVFTLSKIAAGLGCSVIDLLGGEASATPPPPGAISLEPVMVLAAVQAGLWRDAVEWPVEDQFAISVPVDERYPGARRFGLEVRGASMDRLYPVGTILICVPFIDIGTVPDTGDHVVCVRRNHDGLVEATVKEFVVDERDRVWLWPRSNQPEFQQPLQLETGNIPVAHEISDPPATVHAGFFQIEEGEIPTIQIAALVTGSYRRE